MLPLAAKLLPIIFLNLCSGSPLMLESDLYDDIAPQIEDDDDYQSGNAYLDAYNDDFLPDEDTYNDNYNDNDDFYNDNDDTYDDLVTVGEDELAADRIMEDFQSQQDQVTLHR